MKHVPHVLVGAPWNGNELELSLLQWRHLTKVLRLKRGKALTYTDGLGTFGEGELTDHAIRRGEERDVPRPVELTVAVAPPTNKDRQRFLVEKLAELGVSELLWLETAHGSDRRANAAKVFSWIHAAVEQSRGAWLMDTRTELVTWEDLEGPVVVCQPGGSDLTIRPRTVVIGPEGGFAEGEIPESLSRWELAPNILRIETAAVVAAARILT